MASPSATEHFHRRQGQRALCLIVADDDRDTVATLSAILESAGHTVYGVHDGREVLRTARFVRPDALIVDISVPGMSGYAIAEVVRATYTRERRPLLIAITGKWKEAPDRRVAEHVGFDHHLLKPCDPNEVLALLEPLRRPD